MKKQLLITIILIIFGFIAYAQPGTIDLTFNPGSGVNSRPFRVLTTSIQSDGKIIIGGFFNDYNGIIVKNSIARLNTDGTLDTSFDTGIGFNTGNVNPPYVNTTAIQSNGKIIIGGLFSHYGTTYSPGIARLNANGTIDNTFNVGNGVNSSVKTISIQSDGKIIIAGNFTSYKGIARNRIARLNPNGTLDTSFDPSTGANGIVYTTAIQNDGKIIIGGSFTSYNGIARYEIARLNTDGTLDTTFNPYSRIGVAASVNSVSIQSDGKIIAGGSSIPINLSTSISSLARLNTDGKADTTFKNFGIIAGIVYTSSIQSDGKIIIGSDFRFARLNTNGNLDATFNPGTGASGTVNTISIQSDGKIIIGGDFTAYNGIGRNCIARINGDTFLSAKKFENDILNVHPNPSSGCFTIQVNDLITTKTIEVYTILGQKIYSKPLTENESTLNLSAQPKGVYLYKVFGDKGETKSGKLVIE